jgi:hypothetical protein
LKPFSSAHTFTPTTFAWKECLRRRNCILLRKNRTILLMSMIGLMKAMIQTVHRPMKSQSLLTMKSVNGTEKFPLWEVQSQCKFPFHRA